MADIPFLALTPGLAIDKVQTQRTRTRAVPSASMLGEGGAGTDRPSPLRAPQSHDLPCLPHLGGGKPEMLTRQGLGRVIALGRLRRAGARRGLNFLFSGLQESRPASGGSFKALASSSPAVAGPSPPPAPPARAGGCWAQGAGGPRRASPGSREGPVTRSQG